MVDNVTAKVFQLISSMNNLLAAYKEFPVDTEEEAFDLTKIMGRSAGSTVRDVFAIEKL